MIRAVGGGRAQVAALLAGAGGTLVGLAVVVAVLAHVLLLQPLITSLLGSYGVFDVSLSGGDVLLTVVAAVTGAVVASIAIAARYSRVTVLGALRSE